MVYGNLDLIKMGMGSYLRILIGTVENALCMYRVTKIEPKEKISNSDNILGIVMKF